MGLLDMFGTSPEDPRSQATLALASTLLGAPKNSMQWLAQGLLDHSKFIDYGKRRRLEEEVRRSAIEETRAQAEQRRAAIEEMAQQRAQQTRDDSILRESFAEQQGPTASGMPLMPGRIDPRFLLGRGASLGAVGKAAQLDAALNPKPENPFGKIEPKDYTPESVAEFARTGNAAALRAAPKEAAPTEIERLIAARDKFPPGSPQYKVIDAAIVKASTHSPQVSVSYGAPVAGQDAAGNPVFFQPSKSGGAAAIIPGVSPQKPDKPLTEAQAKAATFASQMAAAERELGTVKFDQTKLGPQAEVAIAAGAGNLLVGQPAQRVRQAQEQWAEAFLRFKTGAATTKDEVARNVRTYFPQPGDGPDVVSQKQRMRAQAQQDLLIAATGKQSAPTDVVQSEKPARRKYNPETGRIE